MMALGVGGMMLMQVFVNIGGISGLIPSTGVTFPFCLKVEIAYLSYLLQWVLY